MGDLNAQPDTDELAPLQKRSTDAWAAQGDGPGDTFPADSPDRRIDDIFVMPGITGARVEVPETTASAHRPVVVERALSPR